ncbi:MAG TPA: DUF1993 domain-containing protein [Burkholderiales bacterium]|nr:DUF1993 domain-containing protein [Burkholderiales bacterium]
MAISMYQVSIPVLVRALNNLNEILAKAAAHAEAKKIDPAVLIGSRLYPDMFALARQVQVATDTAKGCAARLTEAEPPKYEDTEATFDELSGRIRKTTAYLESFKAGQIDGSESKKITLKLRDRAITFDGADYLLNFVLPNFFFHVTTAYDILRHCGVELGKRDFLGKL